MLRKFLGAKKPETRDPMGHARRVMQSNTRIDFDFEGYAEKHIFNKVSRDSEYGFYYYPYGYLFRYPKWGTINEMGFRCAEDIPDLRAKYLGHFIIAVFGGSTGFDILVPDHETFCTYLENLLNADTELRRKVARDFKVINLSQPGNVLLNQIINYIIFCPRLKPELVISHHGVNDASTVQLNDRKLVSRYDIAYPDVLEAWARKIHDCTDVEIDYDFAEPSAPNFKPATVRNRPQDVLHTYHARLLQFNQLVRGAGQIFVNGLQPWLFSKAKASPSEQEKWENYSPYYRPAYANCPALYEQLEQIFDREAPDNLVNLHRCFKELGDNETHFGDACHLLGPGNKVVGEQYYKKVREVLMK